MTKAEDFYIKKNFSIDLLHKAFALARGFYGHIKQRFWIILKSFPHRWEYSGMLRNYPVQHIMSNYPPYRLLANCNHILITLLSSNVFASFHLFGTEVCKLAITWFLETEAVSSKNQLWSWSLITKHGQESLAISWMPPTLDFVTKVCEHTPTNGYNS